MMEKLVLTAKEQEQVKALEKDLDAMINDPVMPVPGCGVMAFILARWLLMSSPCRWNFSFSSASSETITAISTVFI